jgi:hypothetical protein
MVYGLWFMVYGLWFMVYGLWFMVYGLWFMVYGLWFCNPDITFQVFQVQGLKQARPSYSTSSSVAISGSRKPL